MIGSARCSRSYGFTHGSIGAQALRAFQRHRANRIRATRMSAPCGNSFAHQTADAAQVLILIAWLVAAVDHAHSALAVDDYGARHAGDAIERTHLALRIVEDGETHRRLLQPVIGGLRVRLDIYADHRESHFAIFFIDSVKERHLLPTRAAPARPKVEHYDLAFELREFHRRPALRVQGEIGRWRIRSNARQYRHCDEERRESCNAMFHGSFS